MDEFTKYKHGELIIASPSGGGKTALIKNLLKKYSKYFVFPPLTTTRKKRKEDKTFKRKCFVNGKVFQKQVKNNELIMVRVNHGGKRYGMSIKNLKKACDTKKVLIFDTTSIKGIKKIKSIFPEANVIVILPFKNLKKISKKKIRELLTKRISKRGSISKEEIKKELMKI